MVGYLIAILFELQICQPPETGFLGGKREMAARKVGRQIG